MQIVIIGSGNVAYHLAKAFKESGIEVFQIFGRNATELSKISEELHIPFSTETLADADLYLISVSDSSIAEVSTLIKKENVLVAHTSGSVSREALVGNYRKSVFYPLQTFSKSKKLDYKKIPFFIDAENEEDAEILKNLALKISENVMFANDEKRKYIHLTAVFACNFANHMYALSARILEKHHIPFEVMLSLIDETAKKVHELPPAKAQTGPAIRYDENVINRHLDLLADVPDMQELYEKISKSIYKQK